MDNNKQEEAIEAYFDELMCHIDDYIEAREGLKKILDQVDLEKCNEDLTYDTPQDAINSFKKGMHETLKENIWYVVKNIVK